MPIVTLQRNARKDSFTGTEVAIELLNSNNGDLVMALASLGFGAVSLATGNLIGFAYGIAGFGLSLQSFQDVVDRESLESKISSVLNIMKSRENSGIDAGYLIMVSDKIQYQSANGNNYSGVYYKPVNVYWSSTRA